MSIPRLLVLLFAVAGCAAGRSLPVVQGPGGVDAFDAVVIPHATRAVLPTAVGAGRFSGGRHPDFVVVSLGDLGTPTLRGAVTEGSLAVILGESAAGRRFIPIDEYYAGRGAVSLAIADFNGDGRLDVAVAAIAGVSGPELREQTQSASPRQAGEIRLFWGRGDGTFEPGPVAASPVPFPVNLLAADVDGDGRSDLLMGTLSDRVRGIGLLRNAGNDRFDPVIVSVASVSNRAIAIGQFRSRDKIDVAVVGRDSQDSSQAALSILFNNGHGGFERSVPTVLQLQDVGHVVAANFVKDRQDEIVVGTSSGLYLYRVEPDATVTRLTRLTGNFSALDMAAADLDSDGNMDLVVPSDFVTYAVLFGDGRGGFSRRIELRASVSPRRIGVEPRDANQPVTQEFLSLSALRTTPAIVDVDGDGRPDIVIPATPLAIVKEYRATDKLPSEAREVGGYLVVFFNRLRFQ